MQMRIIRKIRDLGYGFSYRFGIIIRQIILRYLRLEKGQIWELRGKKWKYRWPVKITSFCEDTIYYEDLSLVCSRGNMDVIKFFLTYRKVK